MKLLQEDRTFRILVESEWHEILLLQGSSGNRMLSVFDKIRGYIPANRIRSNISYKNRTAENYYRGKRNIDTHITSKTLPSAVHTGYSNGVNVSLNQNYPKINIKFNDSHRRTETKSQKTNAQQ